MSPLTVNLTTLLYVIVVPLATPLSTYFIDTYGLSKSVKFGMVLSVIGACNKIFINDIYLLNLTIDL